jgi:hypothetical protein
MLEKVISGGQTGADAGGLRAAQKCGLKTGGWLPKGCVTQNGSDRGLIAQFGMLEHDKAGYPPRTEANVRDSDATIRLASNFRSAGEVCTLKSLKWYKKPYLDIDIKNPLPVSVVAAWIREKNVKTLNVAGNAESTSPGIGAAVEAYLEQVFNQCREARNASGQADAGVPLDS